MYNPQHCVCLLLIHGMGPHIQALCSSLDAQNQAAGDRVHSIDTSAPGCPLSCLSTITKADRLRPAQPMEAWDHPCPVNHNLGVPAFAVSTEKSSSHHQGPHYCLLSLYLVTNSCVALSCCSRECSNLFKTPGFRGYRERLGNKQTKKQFPSSFLSC